MSAAEPTWFELLAERIRVDTSTDQRPITREEALAFLDRRYHAIHAETLQGRGVVRRLLRKLVDRARVEAPTVRVINPYFLPEMVRMRTARGAAVCVDPDCELSGGAAHVGDCEPCGCPLNHALVECPTRSAAR